MSNFGYRTLGFGSFPNRAAASGPLVFPGWSATVTMGTNNTKSDHYTYGFDTSTIHNNNSIGSITDNTLDDYQFIAADGTTYEDATVTRVSWHYVNGSTSDTGVRFKIIHGDISGAQNKIATYSNIKDLTLTIGSTDFDFGDDTFNKLCSVSGNVYDHFFQTTSNPFGGTSGDVTVSINAGS